MKRETGNKNGNDNIWEVYTRSGWWSSFFVLYTYIIIFCLMEAVSHHHICIICDYATLSIHHHLLLIVDFLTKAAGLLCMHAKSSSSTSLFSYSFSFLDDLSDELKKLQPTKKTKGEVKKSLRFFFSFWLNIYFKKVHWILKSPYMCVCACTYVCI